MIVANKSCGGSVLRRASMTGSLSSTSALSSSSKLRRSSSSLYLQGLAIESCGSPSPSPSLSPSSSVSYSHSNSVDQLQQTFEALDLCGGSTLPTIAPVDAEGKKVVIQTLLVLVALKVVPGYLLELLQNMELQGVPLVLALGLVPTMMFKLNQGKCSNDDSWESRASVRSPSELETHIQNSRSWYDRQMGGSESFVHGARFQGEGAFPQQEPSRSTSSGSLQDDEGGDEWGQFAFYEEPFRDDGAPASSMARSCSQSSSSPRSSSLQTLVEMEEEEEEEWDEDLEGSCTF